MTLRTIFHPLAERELLDAAAFYDEAREGVGARFVLAVERCVGTIASQPGVGRPLPDGRRRLRVRRFPYSVIYRAFRDHVRILAIAAQKRRPFYWTERR